MQEPFANLFAQGMITRDGAKMSKSRGNTVSPGEYVERFGADAARCYVLFIGPPERAGLDRRARASRASTASCPDWGGSVTRSTSARAARRPPASGAGA